MIRIKIITTLNQIKKNPRLVLYSAFSDISFIILFAFFSSAIFDKMLEYAVAAGSLTARSSEEFGSVVASSPTFIQAISSIQGVKPLLLDIVILSIILIFGGYVFYSFFQGLSWYFAGKISNSKNRFYKFMKLFLKVNIIWVLIYALLNIIKLIFDFFRQTSGRIYAGENFNLTFIVPFLALIFIYFAIISYANIINKEKSRIKDGIIKVKQILPVYLIAVFIVLIIHIIQLLLFKQSIIMGGIIFLLIEIPALTFARTFMIISLRENEDK